MKWLLFCCILLFSIYVLAQDPEGVPNAQGSCQPLTIATTCSAFVYFPVFTNSTAGLTQIEQSIATYLSLMANVPGIPAACLSIARTLLCGDAYKMCQTVETSQGLFSVSVPPCRSLCERANSACQVVFQEYAGVVNPLDCEEIDSISQTYRFAPSSVTYRFPDSSTATFACNDMVNNVFTANLLSTSSFADSQSTQNWTEFTPALVSRGPVLNLTALIVNNTVDGNTEGIEQILPIAGAPLKFRLNVTARFNDAFSLNITNPVAGAEAEFLLRDNTTSVVFLPFTSTPSFQSKSTVFIATAPVTQTTVRLISRSRGEIQFANVSLSQATNQVNEALILSTCFPPLITAPDGSCQIVCPPPVWEDPFLDNVVIMVQIFSWISMICCLITIGTWFLRRYSGSAAGKLDSSVLFMCICCLIFSVFLGPFNTAFFWHDTVCENEYTMILNAREQNAVKCAVQGTAVFFGALSFILWWFWNVVKIALVIHFPRSFGAMVTKPGVNRVEVITHSVVWSLAASLALGAYFDGKGIGGTPGSIMCFVRQEAWLWLSFYGPMAVLLLIAVPIMLKSIYSIWQVRRDAKREQDWELYVRFMLFLGFMFFNFAILLMNKAYAESITSQTIDKFTEWVQCQAENQGDTSQCVLNRPTGAIAAIQNWCVASQGLILFLLFTFQKKTWLLWWAFIRCQPLSSAIPSKKTGANSAVISKSKTEFTNKKESSVDVEGSMDRYQMEAKRTSVDLVLTTPTTNTSTATATSNSNSANDTTNNVDNSTSTNSENNKDSSTTTEPVSTDSTAA